MVADQQNIVGIDSDEDTLIGALIACLREGNHPHQRLSSDSLSINLHGHWQEYDVIIQHYNNDGHLNIRCPLPIELFPQTCDKLYPLTGQMSNNLQLGQYYTDAVSGEVGFRLIIPEIVLSGMDIETLEVLLETAVESADELYPVCQSLVNGRQSIEAAMAKYMDRPQGTA